MKNDDQNLQWKLCKDYFAMVTSTTNTKLSLEELCAYSKISYERAIEIIPKNHLDYNYFFLKILVARIDLEALDELKNDESLVQGAISETLRYESSGKTGLARYASEDIELNGHEIKKGQMVQLITSTAGMDPKIYENPRKFDIRRDHDKSISFGQGPHYCIGVTLVRSQTEVMLKELFKRFPNLSLGNEIIYDYDHHNARRMDVMTVQTNLN